MARRKPPQTKAMVSTTRATKTTTPAPAIQPAPESPVARGYQVSSVATACPTSTEGQPKTTTDAAMPALVSFEDRHRQAIADAAKKIRDAGGNVPQELEAEAQRAVLGKPDWKREPEDPNRLQNRVQMREQIKEQRRLSADRRAKERKSGTKPNWIDTGAGRRKRDEVRAVATNQYQGWDDVWAVLPDPIKQVIQALKKAPNNQLCAKELKMALETPSALSNEKPTQRDPATIWHDYKSWKPQLDRWILRPRRGLYVLSILRQETP